MYKMTVKLVIYNIPGDTIIWLLGIKMEIL